MALPHFRSLAARRKEKEEEKAGDVDADRNAVVNGESEEKTSTRTVTPNYTPRVDIKRATRNRSTWIAISCLFFFISVIFLILTIIGNINKKAVIRDTYFFKINLSNIIPASTPADIVFTNSLAQSLGLHEFYQVGLWSFCEGYTSITDCSKPKTLYWFNPVEILLNELLSGATIVLPAEVNNILSLIRIASHLVFGFFLTGVCMNFVSIFITPVTLYSRWWSFPIVIWTFVAALLTTAATIIATVMFVVFKHVITSQSELNIGGSLGNQMFAFMWIGATFSIFGFVIHLCLSCCGASRRDVKTGRRKGNKAAYGDAWSDEKKSPVQEKRRPMLRLGRRKNAEGVV